MTRKRRPLGGDSQGPKVSTRLGGSTISIVPRPANVVNLDAYRRSRVELPPGPNVCPPSCEWCFAPNRLDRRGWPS
jgi:hypothetical protein